MTTYLGSCHCANISFAAINLRCIENLDLDAVPVHHFDGKSK